MTLQSRNLEAHLRLATPAVRSDFMPLPRHVLKGAYTTIGKRVLDIALILVTLPIVLLVVGTMALLVALDGHNPFYSQTRVGRGGRHFRLWKIRTMVPNAEKILEDYLRQNPDARTEWNLTQKLKSDPRVTFFGRIMRKSSLDELPQLFNVFTGTMSLVGPRPMMVDQIAAYPGEAYYQMRPGVTGFWQVSERNDAAFTERARFDTDYYTKVSLRVDITTLFKTVAVVVRGTGY